MTAGVVFLLRASLVVAIASTTILDASAGARIRDRHVHCEDGFAPPRLVDDLRTDIVGLAEAGLFSSAGSGGRAGSADTMRSALYCDPIARSDRAIGMWDAFFATWERLDMVRLELEESLGRTLLPEMEVHYVHYEHGGYYQRHVDDEMAESSHSPGSTQLSAHEMSALRSGRGRPGAHRFAV